MIKLDLTVEEVNFLLQALGELPYKAVFPLVEKIKTQAQPQVQPPAAE